MFETAGIRVVLAVIGCTEDGEYYSNSCGFEHEDTDWLGSEESYAISELAVEAGFAVNAGGGLWQFNLFHVGYSPDAGATGPFYLGVAASSTF